MLTPTVQSMAKSLQQTAATATQALQRDACPPAPAHQADTPHRSPHLSLLTLEPGGWVASGLLQAVARQAGAATLTLSLSVTPEGK